MKNITGYELSRNWFDFCFENPDKIKPNHTAVYFMAVEHCNRLGWKEKFGFPTNMVMEAIGIKSYNTYIKILNDIIDWGFIKLIERSKNQHSTNIIALSGNDKAHTKAHTKALDKALIKHASKHIPKQRESTYQSTYQSTGESTYQSKCSIIKQETIELLTNKTIKLLNKEYKLVNSNLEKWIKEKKEEFKEPEKEIYKSFDHLKITIEEFDSLLAAGYSKAEIDETLEKIENYKNNKKYKSLYLTAKAWLKRELETKKTQGNEPKINRQTVSTLQSGLTNWGRTQAD